MKYSYFFVMCFFIILLVFILIKTLMQKNKKAAKEFSISIFLLLVCTVFFSLSLVISNPEVKFLIHEMKFFGMAFIPTSILATYLRLIDKDDHVTRNKTLVMCIVPTIAVILAITNNYHHLFRKNMFVVEESFGSFVGVESNIAFFVYSFYSYFLYSVGVAFLCVEFFKTPKIYRDQMLMLIVSGVTSLLIGFMASSSIIYDVGDSTIISLCVSSLLQYIAIIKYKPTRVILMARNLAFNEINAPILVFDYNDVLLDSNVTAKKMFKTFGDTTVKSFISEKLGFPENTEQVDEMEICLEMEEKEYYILNDKKIFDDDDKYTSRTIFLNDITDIKTRTEMLETLAMHDYLTDMQNRHAFSNRLKKIVKDDLPVVVVLINVNDMRFINNVYGSKLGDEIIVFVSKAILSLMDEKKYCARLNGDEFAVLLFKSSEAEAVAFFDSLKEKILEYSLNNHKLAISVGIGIKTTDKDNTELVIKTAQDNMNKNKLLASIDKDSAFASIIKSLDLLGTETEQYHNYKKELATKLASKLNIQISMISELQLLLEVHNLGLLNLPPHIAKHRDNFDNLTEADIEIYKTHTIKGYNMALSIKDISSIAKDIICHHENFDGTGYPHNLKGSEIPILAQIINFSVYVTTLAIENKLSQNEIKELLDGHSGTRFNPELVKVYKEIC